MKPPKLRGQPLKIKTVKQLQKLIQEYFDECYRFDENIQDYINTQPITISGLCLHLGISRETLREYGNREDYVDTIKEAKLSIENYAENQLFNNPRTAGIIFNLKNNFKWVDKSVVESNNTNIAKTLTVEFIGKDSTIEE